MEKIIGIYKITNLINGHTYIGMSRDCLLRKSDHFNKAMHSQRRDDLAKPLYKAIRKYGKENFSFEVIEECSVDRLAEREIYWIKHYNTYLKREHYNLTPGGDGRLGDATLHGEDHPCAVLTEQDVLFLREKYKENSLQGRELYERYFADKISYAGFQNAWHGRSWKKVAPEVFEDAKPLRSKFTRADAEFYKREFEESGLNLNQYSKTKKGQVGYGTLWKMINETWRFPEELPKVKRSR